MPVCADHCAQDRNLCCKAVLHIQTQVCLYLLFHICCITHHFAMQTWLKSDLPILDFRVNWFYNFQKGNNAVLMWQKDWNIHKQTHICFFQNTSVCTCGFTLYMTAVMVSIKWAVCTVYHGKDVLNSTLPSGTGIHSNVPNPLTNKINS